MEPMEKHTITHGSTRLELGGGLSLLQPAGASMYCDPMSGAS